MRDREQEKRYFHEQSFVFVIVRDTGICAGPEETMINREIDTSRWIGGNEEEDGTQKESIRSRW